MKLSASFALVAVLLCSGCYVRMPSDEGAERAATFGEVRTLRRDLVLADSFSPAAPIAFGAGDESGLREKKQFRGEIMKGSRVRVVGVVSRRMEAGISRYYECVDEAAGTTFDLPFRLRDSIGYPAYTAWP